MDLNNNSTAGIYIHIPFCKQACAYCDFHFSTLKSQHRAMVAALVSEVKQTQSYLNGKKLSTIYFGGGTPSILPSNAIAQILEAIAENHETTQIQEITLEANPDDINMQKLDEWYALGINRLSVGIQSWNKNDLIRMNRAHQVQDAHEALVTISQSGFKNFSIDLMYGLPFQSISQWDEHLEQTIAYSPTHIAAYHLTIEPKTAFDYQKKKGYIQLPEDELSEAMFFLMREKFRKAGYNHYEISNFSKPGFESKHNSSYWSGKWYLGIGPSAHSFNGKSRQWNIANNSKYLQGIMQGKPIFEIETLTEKNLWNEWLMTQLRLLKGLSIAEGTKKFGEKPIQNLLQSIEKLFKEHFEIQDDFLRIKPSSLLLSDGIIANLFEIE